MATAINSATTRGTVITWKLTPDDPEGDWVNSSEQPYKTVAIEGGQATLYGCMSRDGMEFELRDAHDNPIKSPAIFNLSLNPAFIRPVLIRADNRAVVVTIVGSRM